MQKVMAATMAAMMLACCAGAATAPAPSPSFTFGLPPPATASNATATTQVLCFALPARSPVL